MGKFTDFAKERERPACKVCSLPKDLREELEAGLDGGHAIPSAVAYLATLDRKISNATLYKHLKLHRRKR